MGQWDNAPHLSGVPLIAPFWLKVRKCIKDITDVLLDDNPATLLLHLTPPVNTELKEITANSLAKYGQNMHPSLLEI